MTDHDDAFERIIKMYVDAGMPLKHGRSRSGRSLLI
jgi:hypothetical protein